MKSTKKITLIITSFILIILSYSCIKDSFDFDKLTNEIHWQPSLAVPVAYGNLSMVDGINTYDSANHIVVNEDGYLSVVFYETVETDTVSEIITLNNQQLNKNISSSGIDFTGFDTPGDNLVVNYSYDLPFTLFNPDAEIDSIWFDEGIIDLASVSTFEHSIELTITLPTVKKNGQAFSKSLTLQPFGDNDQDLGNEIAGYHADLTQTPAGFNQIPVEITLDFTHSGGNYNGNIGFQVDILQPGFEAMYGYFGRNTLIYESAKISIDLFDMGENWDLDDFRFEDPKLKVNYKNSYGIPTNFFFDSLRAYSKYYDIDFDVITYNSGFPMDSLNPYEVSFATTFNQDIEDSLMVDKTNSNIADIIQQRPAWFKFIAHAHTNPGGSASHNNFITGDSRFWANVKVELPAWGYIDRFHGYDTADFDLDKEFNDPGIIERLMLRLNIDNGLPAKASAQAYFLDSNYVILDSIIKDNDLRIIEEATVDGDGRVISKSFRSTDITVTGQMLEDIKNTKYILYKASASTTDAGSDKLIKIYEDYEVDFSIAIEADIDAEVDLDTL